MEDLEIGHYGMFSFDSRKANLCAGPMDPLHFTDPSIEDPLAGLDSDDEYFSKHHSTSLDDLYLTCVPYLKPCEILSGGVLTYVSSKESYLSSDVSLTKEHLEHPVPLLERRKNNKRKRNGKKHVRHIKHTGS